VVTLNDSSDAARQIVDDTRHTTRQPAGRLNFS